MRRCLAAAIIIAVIACLATCSIQRVAVGDAAITNLNFLTRGDLSAGSIAMTGNAEEAAKHAAAYAKAIVASGIIETGTQALQK